jgi:hypothetical protein
MIEGLSLTRLGLIAIYALAVGMSFRLMAILWRRLWNIEIGALEGNVLVVGIILMLITLRIIEKGPLKASMAAGLLIAGYFVIKLIKKYFGE